MIASYGRLGDIVAGREALAGYRELTPLSPEELIRRAIHDPATVQALLEGVAVIERGAPSTRAGAKAHG